MDQLMKFLHVRPRLPSIDEKDFAVPESLLGISSDMNREEIIERLESIRDKNRLADLAFYAWRDLSRIDHEPFVAAAIERNPVGVTELSGCSEEEAAAAILELADESIYDGPHRLAQPDEVWNYGRGDGVEKALLLASVLHSRDQERPLKIEMSGGKAVLRGKGIEYQFATSKDFGENEWVIENMDTPFGGAENVK